uniref:UDP-gluconosyltransferase n=1 Tax=Trialeurodes vaporariorum TaxID=88556 RepID=A0A873P541_TRIVP|nr:UDP-gluconosyltransferase [Trialeurodes vaporariorum]
MTYLLSYIYLVGLGLGAVGYYGVNAANILVLSPVISHSHTIHVNALTRALAARGHKLVILSPDPEKQKNDNITIIHLEGGFDMECFKTGLEEMPPSENVITLMNLMFDNSIEACELLLFSEGNKRFLREYKNHKFDIIVIDAGFMECFLKYAHVFDNIHIVGFSAYFSVHPSLLGDFDNPSYVPHHLSYFTDKMNFRERVSNWFYYTYYSLMRRFWFLPKQDALSQEFFGFYYPTVSQIEDRFALFLSNEHFSITYPKARAPASIPVGGLHIKPPKLLPKDLDAFISGAKHGVIYFSLGSNFESKYMSSARKRMFLDAFAQLPQRVLWKYEDDTLTNIPPNVKFQTWFPQTDILAHENTKLFITHNGYLSTQESIHYGVPMLGVPIICDQFNNNARIKRMGLGLGLNLKEIKSSKEILDKLKTILDDPSYKQRAVKESLLFKDRPMGPLDTAVYWIEYVIRHKGADALQVASLDLYWFQYYLLDIYATIGGTIFALYYVLKKLFCAIFRADEKLKKS